MLLTTLLFVAAATNLTTALGALGFRIRNKSLKDSNRKLKIDHDDMRDTVADALADHIQPKHVAAYLKAVKQAGHKWQVIEEREMVWGNKPHLKEDTLTTQKCKCCGMVNRIWERGLGTVDQPNLAGFWIGDRKLGNDEREVYECQAITNNQGAQKILEKDKEMMWETQTSLK